MPIETPSGPPPGTMPGSNAPNPTPSFPSTPSEGETKSDPVPTPPPPAETHPSK